MIVYVCLVNTHYEGYGEPELVTADKAQAYKWQSDSVRDRDNKNHDYDIFEYVLGVEAE